MLRKSWLPFVVSFSFLAGCTNSSDDEDCAGRSCPDDTSDDADAGDDNTGKDDDDDVDGGATEGLTVSVGVTSPAIKNGEVTITIAAGTSDARVVKGFTDEDGVIHLDASDVDALKDSELYVLTVSGGRRILDGDKTEKNKGTLRITATGAELKSGELSVTAVSELIQVLISNALEEDDLSKSKVKTLRDSLAVTFVAEDVNGDGKVDYQDVLAYDPEKDADSLSFDEDTLHVTVVVNGKETTLAEALADGDTEAAEQIVEDLFGDIQDPSVDEDADSIANHLDNCPDVENPKQQDADEDGIGDACDEDADGDDTEDKKDNCPGLANPDQGDLDEDGLGDACDEDADGDGRKDQRDNCPDVVNPEQDDLDEDGLGDLCDEDMDGDDLSALEDNCPGVPNPDQDDLDEDGLGDACDPDLDGDDVLDTEDNCPAGSNTDQSDVDEDGLGDVCDPDADADDLANEDDNCPLVPNPEQGDLDEDGLGDLCDPDLDGDDVLNEEDNCPVVANADQSNVDGDELGDACDPDADNDELPNEEDNCPLASNFDQLDYDADGFGDACDVCEFIYDPEQPDVDADKVGDLCDNCIDAANRNQADSDFDGDGDACDLDSDNDGLEDPDDNCPQIPNVEQLDTDEDGLGDVCDSLEQTYGEALQGGHLAAFGVGLAGRGDEGVKEQATITVEGIPEDATIHNVWLYLGTIGGEQGPVTLDDSTVDLTLAGTADDTCWGRPLGNFAYRADVTDLFHGDGDYLLLDFLSASSGADGQGASLVILYQDPADTRMNYIAMAEKIATVNTSGEAMANTLGGFTLPETFDSATILNIVGDGQTFADSASFNSIPHAQGVVIFGGAQGEYWDNLWFPVEPYLNPGDQNVLSTITMSSDCLVWVLNAIVIEGYAPG